MNEVPIITVIRIINWRIKTKNDGIKKLFRKKNAPWAVIDLGRLFE